jgi:hypothetical protein
MPRDWLALFRSLSGHGDSCADSANSANSSPNTSSENALSRPGKPIGTIGTIGTGDEVEPSLSLGENAECERQKTATSWRPEDWNDLVRDPSQKRASPRLSGFPRFLTKLMAAVAFERGDRRHRDLGETVDALCRAAEQLGLFVA